MKEKKKKENALYKVYASMHNLYILSADEFLCNSRVIQ